MASTERAVATAAIVDRLRAVTDPELDRSIVDLGYLDAVEPGRDTVIRFTLPTAWCSPAFAWMMAIDIREAALAEPGVERVTVDLRDHMHGAQISDGVTAGRPFEAVFPDATEGIEATRAALDAKARLARQHAAMEVLEDAGLTTTQLRRLERRAVTLSAASERAHVALDGITVCVPAEPMRRYCEKARAVGVVTEADDRLFATPDGDPIPAGDYEAVKRRARAARVNMSGQAGICGALHEARSARANAVGDG